MPSYDHFGLRYYGHEFQAKFHWHLEDVGIRHAYIKPRTPRLNGKVERSHGTDQREFYQLLTYKDDVDLHAKLAEWEAFYNYHRLMAASAGKHRTSVWSKKCDNFIGQPRLFSSHFIGQPRLFSSHLEEFKKSGKPFQGGNNFGLSLLHLFRNPSWDLTVVIYLDPGEVEAPSSLPVRGFCFALL